MEIVAMLLVAFFGLDGSGVALMEEEEDVFTAAFDRKEVVDDLDRNSDLK
jgi:hypothetical protein